MANQQLLDYIRQQAQQGKTKEEIKKELLGVGWQEKDIEEAFSIFGLAQLPSSSIPSAPIKEETLASSTLPGVGDLLKRTFSIYKARLGTFVGIMIFPSIVGLLLLIPPLFILKSFTLGILLFIIFLLITVAVSIWSQVSLIFAIKDRGEKIGITESLRRGWHKIISFIWISFLVGFITTGGSVLFIIPGIIFSIWFAFSFYILVSEDLRGMNVLFRSKQLVAGYWWKVLWRFFVSGFVVFVPIMLVYMVILFVFPFQDLADTVIRFISSLFIAPFTSVFGFLLYEDLKRQKAQIPFEPPKKGTKIKFIIIGIIGLLLIPAILASIVLVSLSQIRKRVQAVDVTINMIQLRPVMEIYWEKNKSYDGANCSLPELTPICNNIEKYTGEMPTIRSSAENYCFYARLPSGKYICISSVDIYSSDRETTIFPGGPGYCDGVTFNCPISNPIDPIEGFDF